MWLDNKHEAEPVPVVVVVVVAEDGIASMNCELDRNEP